jgi:hypothetical protein
MGLKYLYLPSGVKAGTAYGVMPNSESADFDDFSRGSTATRVDKNGFIETVDSNVPRLDYTDGGCPSLLLEPQRTNLFPYSEDFENSDWTKNAGTTITNNYAISPDGNLNAARYLGTGASGLGDKFTLSATDYTISIWVKSNNGVSQFCRLIGDSSNISSDLLITTEWTRLSYTFTGSGLSDKTNGIFRDSNNNDIDILIYGAQLEQGSYPTSYIPTFGAASTRSQDVGGSTGDISSEFDSREGTFFFEGSFSDFSGANRVSLNSSVTTFQDRISISTDNTRFLIIYEAGDVGGSFPVFVSDLYANIKIAVKWSSGSVVCYTNGVESFDRTNIGDFSQNSLNRVTLANANESTPFKGKVKQFRVYDEVLSDAEIEELTSWTSFNEMANALNYIIE